ncbi:MAG TPA: hypothetical protein DHW64_03065 [Chitinophagaceae bacterium]|nr:hypothetical protein [Chitinophagaceae bacterium]
MNAYANKSGQHVAKTPSAQEESDKKNEAVAATDNRPVAKQQSTLQGIANSSAQVAQLKAYQLMSHRVVQAKGINYEAGTGEDWHVHKDHVKYDGDNSSRINFTGKTKTQIKKAMQEYHDTLGHSKERQTTYIACRRWVSKYL